MKKSILVIVALLTVYQAWAKDAIDPVISPSLFKADTEITVTYDVTGTGLAALTNAYAWVWIPGKNTNAKYNVNPASSNISATNNAKFTKSVVDGRTYFTLKFVPADFFSGSISAETQMGILLKGNDWADGQTSDYLANFWDGSFQISLVSPAREPLFVIDGQQIEIAAETPVLADYSLYINDVLVAEEASVLEFSYTHTVDASSGNGLIKIVAVSDGNTSEKIFAFILSAPSSEASRPDGIVEGINYHEGDDTHVTLCLLAPGKVSAYVVGDFSEWKVLPEFLMKRDGEHFWIEVTGLTAGQEYAFQYLVDEAIYVADPYADKILDPDDQYIPESVYPNLKQFPSEALKNDWYFNRLSVLQTGQGEYEWEVTDFERPEKEALVIYELLIRDFFENGERSYDNLTDTLSYLKRLGINAIELMPVTEFNGNESWGYNPTFMFAPDKYYGTKDALKRLIDECHKAGISVIMDMVLNHQDIPNPYVLLDYDFATSAPEADNKWFNVRATHPFNVFYDMNHESAYTKKYMDTINWYWLNEFKVDGFRFDLSKGFTQTDHPDDVSAWSAYDASRIAILKRMADRIWEHSPDAYVILEHLSVNEEEKELAEYRADEGMGMLLWGKMTDQYNQNTMGFSENSSISGVYHKSRNWSAAHLVGYMESHDEERLMYKNIQYGNKSGSYNIKDLETALSRQYPASLMFYTVPGPKMLWQFGELGYDFSINHCEDGTNSSNCRISPKPVHWDYLEDASRYGLYRFTSELIHLRNEYDVFTHGEATIANENTLAKQIQIKNVPYTDAPTSTEDMNAVAVSNFDVVEREISVSFPHAGKWFDYYSGGGEISVSGSSFAVTLPPGGYKLFTDVNIGGSVITGVEETFENVSFQVFPNPMYSGFTVSSKDEIRELVLFSARGEMIIPGKTAENTWSTVNIPPGFYILEIHTSKGKARKKIIKN